MCCSFFLRLVFILSISLFELYDTAGFGTFRYIGQSFGAGLAIICILFSYTMTARASNIWTTQQAHLRLLQQHIFLLKYADAKHDSSEIGMVQDMMEFIKKYDIPPSAFGVSLKPRILHVFHGYLGSIVLALGGKYYFNK